MDLNLIYEQRYFALVAADGAATQSHRDRHFREAHRLSAIIQGARVHGTGNPAS